VKLVKTLVHLFHPQRSNNHRPKFLHPKALFFLSIIAVGFYQAVGLVSTIHPVKGSVLGYASNIEVVQVVTQTNSLRSKSGLKKLTYSNQLSQAAVSKAQNMFTDNYWAHTSPSGLEPWDFIKSAGYVYKIAGENLARDFDSTSPMMNAWMNSTTHRANIMNPKYEEIGIAVVDGLLNGVETTLVVQMFGSPQTKVAANQPSVSVPAITTTTNTKNINNNEDSKELLFDVNEFNKSIEGNNSEVLAKSVIPQGSLSNGILYSPQHVLKAFFLSMILILITVLVYDSVVAGHKNSVRFVGKNLAHIMVFVAVMYLVIAFKGGVVGP
jgi:hypothetical protein